MPTELAVRGPIDDRELTRLHARTFGGSAADRVTIPWWERLERYSVSWVTAYDGERLVGFVHACWDGGTHAFLLDAVVDPDRQGQGIGSDLVSALVEQVRAAGCDWLHVDFEPAREGFYRRCGFGPTPAGLLRLN